MSIKALQKSVKSPVVQVKEVKSFISKGGSLAKSMEDMQDDHRLTLRIPQWLMEKIDAKRKERVGTVSRNLFILEVLERATKE